MRYQLMNNLGINKRFTRVRDFHIDQTDLVCPFEGTIQKYGIYEPQQAIISKSKAIIVDHLLGPFANQFHGGSYIAAYLSPRNKHFWILPADGQVVHIHTQSGTARFLKTIVGLENVYKHIPFLRHSNLLQKAIKRNATCTVVLKTQTGYIALIAVGSLGVNHIHNYLQLERSYPKGYVAGHFALGSSFILLMSKAYVPQVSLGKIAIGQSLV